MKALTEAGRRGVPLVLTAALFLMWLLLNDTLSLAHIVLGLIIAIAIAWASGVLRPLRPQLRRPRLILVLVAHVLYDVLRSNVGVARIVIGLACGREVRSGFVKIPLTLTDSHGLAVLAGIVTATPGTVWVDHDPATSTVTLHVLDLKSDQEWIDWIKERYERLLLGIFE